MKNQKRKIKSKKEDKAKEGVPNHWACAQTFASLRQLGNLATKLLASSQNFVRLVKIKVPPS